MYRVEDKRDYVDSRLMLRLMTIEVSCRQSFSALANNN